MQIVGALSSPGKSHREQEAFQGIRSSRLLQLLPATGKRRFDAVDAGEALCKRFRPARKALVAHIHRSAGAVGSSALPRAGYSLKQPLTGAFKLLEKHLAPPPMEPDDLSRGLVRPLQPWPVQRPILPAPRPGSRLLWDLRPRDEPAPLNAKVKAEDCRQPLSYIEYLSWLQEVLPESMQPEQPQPEEEADEHRGLSALELLQRISAAACPPSPEPESRVPPLTEDERQAAEQILGEGDPNEIMVSKFNVDITREKMRCLRHGQWLNDEVINFYFKLLQERGKLLPNAPQCWFPNSFFWPKLSGNNCSYSYKEVKRWTIKAKIDIFALDLICFPMNIGESHWAMGVIDLKTKGFRYFDSMFCRPHKNFVPFLQKYVEDEHKAKKGKPIDGVEAWDLIPHENPVPQQENGYDCGVFTCFFADYFSAGRELVFEQADMPNLRQRLAARVVAADENF